MKARKTMWSGRRPHQPDPNFPGLDRRRASSLRTEIRTAAAQRGASARISGRTLRIDHPRLGSVDADLTGTINALAGNEHPKAPRRLAQSLIDQMLATPKGEGTTTANVYAALRPRLRAVQDGTGTFTRDTELTVVLDTGEGFKTMTEEALARIDDPASLRRAAKVNLRGDIESTFDVQVTEQGGGVVAIEAVGSELASAAVDLDLVLDTFAPRIDRTQGLLFGIPAHSTILVAPVIAGEPLIEALNSMAKLCVSYPTDQPLSRLVHFWMDGVVETLSSFDREAQAIVITPNDYLTRLLRPDGNPEG
ncbi:hypothetical protein [Corynebacterium pilosum]|uniref:Uncharacterized protein n=1 Tax=Corynebacterium pilosum TaxID=35756 RepID=A0A376CP75_9CORY|nr:hypothetical protein [Corynebacterium pilosum]STC70095.1 Uncharacterised protein [Corynebacterium pilosum]